MEISYDSVPLPGGNSPMDYFENLTKVTRDIEAFITKGLVKNEEKAFAPGSVFKAFEDYLHSQGKELHEVGTFKKLFGKEDPVKGIQNSLKSLAIHAQEYKDVAALDSYENYNKKGKTSLYMFLCNAQEAGVESKELMESFVVIGTLAGFDIDLSKVKQTDFRLRKDEDFKETAKRIIKRSTSLSEMTVTSENKNEMSEGEDLEYAAAAEMARDGSGRGVNNKKVTVKSSIDDIDYDYAKEKIGKTLESVGKNAPITSPSKMKRNH